MALVVAPGAQASERGKLALSGKAAHGSLAVTAGFGSASTVVRLNGRVRVRDRDLPVLVRTCADSACRHPARTRSAPGHDRAGAGGARAQRARPPAAGQGRGGQRGRQPGPGGANRHSEPEPEPVPLPPVPTVTVSPPEEPASAPSSPPKAEPPLPAPTPPTEPPLPAVHFDYDPSLPDAVVRCEPDERVEVEGIVVPLKAGQSFRVGNQNVRCLPADFPTWNPHRAGATTTRLFAATVGAYAVIADGNGIPVWWMRSPTGAAPFDAKVLDADTIAWTYSFGSPFRTNASYDLRGLDGRLQRTVGGDTLDEHDLEPLANGDYLAIVYSPRNGVDLSPIGGPSNSNVLDGEIREIQPDGTVVWRWSTKDHVAVDESAPEAGIVLGGQPYDLVHMNSVQDDGDGLVFSARHLDAVYRVDKATGAIDWKLGGTHTPQSLAFVDDPIGGFGGQHDARIDADGTLTVHDNQLFKGPPPRAARYRIDPQAGTATLLSQVTDPQVQSSQCCGSARTVPDGHTLVSWGQQPRIAEYDASGTPVLTVDLGSDFSYRAAPVTGDAPTVEQLRAGMDAMAGA